MKDYAFKEIDKLIEVGPIDVVECIQIPIELSKNEPWKKSRFLAKKGVAYNLSVTPTPANLKFLIATTYVDLASVGRAASLVFSPLTSSALFLSPVFKESTASGTSPNVRLGDEMSLGSPFNDSVFIVYLTPVPLPQAKIRFDLKIEKEKIEKEKKE